MEEIKVTNDLMFQRIFGKVGNERITKGFLEKVLGIEIEDLTLDVNKRMQGDMIDDKVGRLDVKVKLSDGTIVLIEMQVARYQAMAERLLYYWGKAYTEDLKSGENYIKLRKTIAILVSVEELEQTKDIEKYHTIWEIREREERDKIFSKDLEIHVIELSKFQEDKERRPEDDWIRFIKAGGKEEMEKLDKVDEAIAEAIEEFKNLVDDPENHEEFLWREKELRDKISFLEDARDRGLKEGREEGRKEERKESIKKIQEIVLEMYKEKIDIKTICKITKLTEAEIDKIIKSNNL